LEVGGLRLEAGRRVKNVKVEGKRQKMLEAFLKMQASTLQPPTSNFPASNLKPPTVC
jgi:hypothetical protein